MMNEKHIDEYIQAEKSISPNPFLRTRIMTKIEAAQNVSAQRSTVLQRAVLTFSLIITAFIGYEIGKVFTPNVPSTEYSLNINDSHIENLSYYKFTNDGN